MLASAATVNESLMELQVLLMAGLTYLIAGPACAGLAKLALIFLATGAVTEADRNCVRGSSSSLWQRFKAAQFLLPLHDDSTIKWSRKHVPTCN